MLTSGQSDTMRMFLKRRLAARDYWLQIPPTKVIQNMRWYVEGRTGHDLHLQACGLDALQCGSVACLAGWLITMPESCPDPSRLRDYTLADRLRYLYDWLGISAPGQYFGARRHDEQGTDWEVGLSRLDRMIADAEYEQRQLRMEAR